MAIARRSKGKTWSKGKPRSKGTFGGEDIAGEVKHLGCGGEEGAPRTQLPLLVKCPASVLQGHGRVQQGRVQLLCRLPLTSQVCLPFCPSGWSCSSDPCCWFCWCVRCCWCDPCPAPRGQGSAVCALESGVAQVAERKRPVSPRLWRCYPHGVAARSEASSLRVQGKGEGGHSGERRGQCLVAKGDASM